MVATAEMQRVAPAQQPQRQELRRTPTAARPRLAMLDALRLVAALSVVLVVFTLGIGLIVAVPLWIALGLAWIVCTLIAAFKAYDGQSYRYPVTIRLFN